MSWKRWKLGLVVAIACGCLSGLAGLAVGMTWRAFVAVMAMSLLTHFLAFLKDHPWDQVDFDDGNRNRPSTEGGMPASTIYDQK
jgi:hypothetical protein